MAVQIVAPSEDVSENGGEPLSLNSGPWLERYWKGSGLPECIWRRLYGIEAAARGASHIAEILAADRQNRELVDGPGKQYVPLAPHHVGGLGDAMNVLIEGALERLEELHDFTGKYGVTIEAHEANAAEFMP